MNSETIWLIIGFAGQLLFSARFLVQWWQSERQRRSVVPTQFWYFSIGGGAILLLYAIHKLDPVFIVGQFLGLLIYSRNIYFITQERNELAAKVASQDSK